MIVRRDMGQLEVPSNKDMEDGVEGLTKITEFDATKDKEARSRESTQCFYLISWYLDLLQIIYAMITDKWTNS